MVASITTGTLIAVYILVMGRLNIDQKVEDPVKTQTLVLAEKLAAYSEEHSGFGPVGICDTIQSSGPDYSGQARRITSLNSAKASLHSAWVVADMLKSKVASDWVEHDLNELEAIERRLSDRMSEIEGSASIDDKQPPETASGQILNTLKQQEPTDFRTVAVSVSLARLKDENTMLLAKTCKYPPSEEAQSYVVNGYFRSSTPVSAGLGRHVRFFPVAERCQIIESNQLIGLARGMMPNAITLTVTYEPKRKSTTKVRFVRRLSALIGGSAPQAMASSCVFRFPQGRADKFKTAAQLFDSRTWSGEGYWQQATGGSVPGSGSLKLTIAPALPAMSPSDALAVGFYHWLRSLNPAPDPKAVVKALSMEFRTISRRTLVEVGYPANSCLAQDTGARERTLMSGGSTEEQRAIGQCFEYPNQIVPFPQSAVPLYIDRSGNVNLAGRIGFDKTLCNNYLEAVFTTNLAALETIATANLVKNQILVESRGLSSRIAIKQLELSSLTMRINSLRRNRGTSAGATSKLDQKIASSLRQIDELNTSCFADQNRLSVLHKILELTRTARLNADRTGAKTYELAATTFTQLRNGLHRFDPPTTAYLLGRHLVFIPIAQPVKEEQFFETANRAVADSSFDESKQTQVSPWFQKDLQVLTPYSEIAQHLGKETIDKKPVSEIISEVELDDDMQPLTVLLDASDLASERNATIHTSTDYPFAATPISEDQAFYYSKNATMSGSDRQALWSVAMRDLLLHPIHDGKSRLIVNNDSSWIKKLSPELQTNCALALEFQVRRPMPEKSGILPGAYIAEPSRHLMTPQIPPIPADLL